MHMHFIPFPTFRDMNDKNCILLFHLSTGDNFTMYAAVRHFQKLYMNVYIFCLYRNRHTVIQLYEPYANVHITIIDETYNHHLAPSNLINQCKFQIKNCVVVASGYYDTTFDGSNGFWKRFYTQLGIPYRIRYQYKDIHRNNERELRLYNSIVSVYGKNYIFLHDHRNIAYQHFNIRPNVHVKRDLPVFHPNVNYYSDLENKTNMYHDLWKSEFMSDNLLDYCTLIENATEIHVSDSAFSCLMPFIDLKNVKIKCIYTNFSVTDYHAEFKNWEILATQ